MAKKPVQQWKFEKRKFRLSELKAAGFDAPQKHTPEEIAILTQAIKEEGQMRPIVVAEDGEILDGAMVAQILRDLGKRTTDCVVMLGLDRKQKVTYRAASNQPWRTLTLDGRKAMAIKLVEIGRRDSKVRLSDRRIGVLCGLTHRSVGNLRKNWEEIHGRPESAAMILGLDNKIQKAKRKPKFKAVRADDLSAGEDDLDDLPEDGKSKSGPKSPNAPLWVAKARDDHMDLHQLLSKATTVAANKKALKLVDEIMRSFDAIQKTAVRYNATLKKPYMKTISDMGKAQKENERLLKEADKTNAELEKRVWDLEKKLQRTSGGGAGPKKKPVRKGSRR